GFDDRTITSAGVRAQIGCHEGFFMSKGSKECFKIFMDLPRSWYDSKKKCKAEGLLTAMPSDAVAVSLRKDLLEKYGEVCNVWLDARGNGSKMVWQHDRTELRDNNSLWWPGSRGVTISHCLFLAVWETDRNRHPRRPYGSNSCSNSFYTLCKVRME
ncbi:unnamed protein product, partial [Meganyctiphanes norvegica]